MSTLNIPNSIDDATAIDAVEHQENYDAIESFVNTEVVHRDGAVAMTGNLTLAGAPSADLHAATKAYVDDAVPVGSGFMWFTLTAPTGYLFAQGQLISKATYPELWALFGDTYGASTETQFRMPNMQGRFPVMRDAAVGAVDTLGETGGSKDATVVAHAHDVTGTAASSGPGYELARRYPAYGTAGYVALADPNKDGEAAGVGSGMAIDAGDTGAHTHPVTGTATSAGSSGTDANLPPYIVVNFIIKAG